MIEMRNQPADAQKRAPGPHRAPFFSLL